MLENYSVNVKIKLAGLWTSLMFLYIYGDYFELYTPNKVEYMLNADVILNSPAKLFAASFVLALPALMISLSLTLRPKINKLLNIVVAGLLTIVVGLVISTSLTPWYAFYFFYGVLEIGITVWIIVTALKWSKVRH